VSGQSKCAAAFNEIKEFRSCFDKPVLREVEGLSMIWFVNRR
jgi:hypothetical protein